MPTKPDYRIGRLSLLDLLGFIIGAIILFFPDLASPGETGSVFHEVVYVPKEIIDNNLNVKIDSLEIRWPQVVRKLLS